MMGLRILLAGQNGIIGSFLYNALREEHKIIGLGKGEYNSPNYFDIDLSNKKEVEVFIKKHNGFDIVIFLVGLAHAKGKNQEYPIFEKINFITLFNLLETLKEHNKLPLKIIFSSTISVYGEKIQKNTYYEDNKLSPSSPYAKTKVLAEKYLKDNFKDISWILRFAPVYSENFKLNIQRRTLIKRKYYKVGEGENKLSLLNINNISFVINEILNNNLPANTYNLADNKAYSYKDLLIYSKAKNIFTFPRFIPQMAYFIGRTTKNIFLQENSIKLLTDNIYSTERLKKFIKLPYSLSSK